MYMHMTLYMHFSSKQENFLMYILSCIVFFMPPLLSLSLSLSFPSLPPFLFLFPPPSPSLPPSLPFFLKVTFIDYGNVQTVPLNYLCNLSEYECHLPAQAMECYLTCVKPSTICSVNDNWAETATARFEELVKEKILEIKVREI